MLKEFMKIFIAIIFLFFSSTASSNEVFNSMGIVANECSKFEELKDFFTNTDNDTISLERYFISAMQGFLSGINYAYENSENTWKSLNPQSVEFMFAYVKDYCSKNPNELIKDGLWEYFFTLSDIN
tara:strand:+ start:1390 stop:1767 length:378 start_codon:yes stop_codon:yes gene_type:complete